MSTIVAVETGAYTEFGADTRTSGSQLNDGWVKKVFQTCADTYTIAVAGDLRAMQVMQYAILPPVPDASRTEDYMDHFFTKSVVPAIKTAFKDADAEEALTESVMLIALRGRVYETSSDGAWQRNVRGRYAMGSGADYALGALEAGASVTNAISIASIYDPGTNDRVQNVVITR